MAIPDERERAVKLLDAETMEKRLIAVIDDPYEREKFYPLILKSAGCELVPRGIVTVLALAIYDYTKDLPQVMSILMHLKMGQLIDAVTDDEGVRTQAKAHWKEIIGNCDKGGA